MAGGSKRYSRNNSNGNFQPLPERGPGNLSRFRYHLAAGPRCPLLGLSPRRRRQRQPLGVLSSGVVE